MPWAEAGFTADIARSFVLDPVRERERLEKKYRDPAQLANLTIEQVREDIAEAAADESVRIGLFACDDHGEIRWSVLADRLDRVARVTTDILHDMGERHGIPSDVRDPILNIVQRAYETVIDGFRVLDRLPKPSDFEVAGVPYPDQASTDDDSSPLDIPACETLILACAALGNFTQVETLANRMLDLAREQRRKIEQDRLHVAAAIGIGPVHPGNERLALLVKALARPGLAERAENGLAALERAEREGTVVWNEPSS